MKPIIRLTVLTLALGALCLSARTNDAAHAQPTWQTVADFQCAPPAAVDALTKDAGGNLYAAVSTSDAEGRIHAVIRKSSDHGATWSVVEDFLPAGEFSMRFLGLGADAAGHLYAAGYAENTNGQMRWIVRKSKVGGASWSTVDDFALPEAQKAVAQGFTLDAAGNLYVAGHASELPAEGKKGRAHWIIRASRDDGRTWSTIDDFAYGFSAKAFAVVSTSNGLFVAGSGWNGDSGSGERWLVRKGTPDGAGGFRWQTVDELQRGEDGQWSESRASALGVDVQGNIYAVGRSLAPRGGHGKAHWTVRRASNEGTDWTVRDMFQLEPECYAAALGVTVDSQGGVYVVGQARSDIGVHWIVRHSATGESASWSVSDDLRLTAPPSSGAKAAGLFAGTAEETVMKTSPTENSRGLAILSASGGIFAGGSAHAGPGHAIVRKLELDRASKLTAASGR